MCGWKKILQAKGKGLAVASSRMRLCWTDAYAGGAGDSWTVHESVKKEKLAKGEVSSTAAAVSGYI